MKINSIENSLSFERGLPAGYPKFVRGNINPSEIERMCKSIGMNVDTGGCQAVAASLLETIKIMSQYSLELPTNFCFAPIEKEGVAGQYNLVEDLVVINSNCEAFYDLEKQNILEESQGLQSSNNKHFLHTYIHEFLHCAHFHNILKTSKNAEDCIKKWLFLTGTKTDNFIVSPINEVLRMFTFEKINDVIDTLFPPKNGAYARTNLAEYFAEKQARIIEENLDNNLDFINKNCGLNLQQSPEGWNFIKELMNINPKESHFFGRKVSSLQSSGQLQQKAKNIDKLFSKIISNSNKIVQAVNATNEIVSVFEQMLEFVDGNIWFGNLEGLDDKNYLTQKFLEGLNKK